MVLKNIVRAAAELLTADDVVAILDGEPDTAIDDDEVKIFMKAANTAVSNAATDGFPIVKTETLVSSGRVIALDAFSRAPDTVREVGTATGRKVAFAFDSRGVSVPEDGEYIVTYTAEPLEAKLEDEAETGAGCNFYMLAFLTARNYCLMTGRSDEAQVWDQLYDSALVKKRIARRASLPPRAWR